MNLYTLTERTCTEACWEARQEVCRCSCSGRNHGCMLVNGAPRPGRTKRVKDTRYRLVAVLSWEDQWDYRPLQRRDHWAFQVVPQGCRWPEAQGADNRAHFAWIEDTYTLEQAQAEMATVKEQETARRKEYHLRNCDGTTMYPNYKIAHPCEEPHSHY